MVCTAIADEFAPIALRKDAYAIGHVFGLLATGGTWEGQTLTQRFRFARPPAVKVVVARPLRGRAGGRARRRWSVRRGDESGRHAGGNGSRSSARLARKLAERDKRSISTSAICKASVTRPQGLEHDGVVSSAVSFFVKETHVIPASPAQHQRPVWEGPGARACRCRRGEGATSHCCSIKGSACGEADMGLCLSGTGGCDESISANGRRGER